jgi:hypothetical protein
MTIRKTGAADGRVTAAGVDPSALEPADQIAPVTARRADWDPSDDAALAAENEAADDAAADGE